MKKSPLKLDRMDKIRRGEPIEECGLTLYPISMRHYDEFLAYKDSLTMRLSAFPARLACMDYLSAIFTADTDEKYESLKTGAFAGAIGFLLLSLRIEATEESLEKMLYFKRENDRTVLSKIVIEQNEKQSVITPSDFSNKLRPILCIQNGLEIPDENMNLDLLKSFAEKRKIERSNLNLKQDSDSLIATVAYMSQARIADVYGWTVWEFEQTRSAIEREKMFSIYKTAELSGMVTFKNGNPVPSLFFDLADDSLGTRSLSEVGRSFGSATDGGELPQNLQK